MSLESQNVVNMRLQPVIKMLLFLNYIYNTLYIFYQNLVASNQDEDYIKLFLDRFLFSHAHIHCYIDTNLPFLVSFGLKLRIGEIFYIWSTPKTDGMK